jgi:hypothetical protein
MIRRMLKFLLGVVTQKLLASVNFWNFKESVESRLGAIESRLEAVESRLTETELRVDTRLDSSENRLNFIENRIGLIENPLNIHRGVLETFYNPVNLEEEVIDFAFQVRKILTVTQQIEAKIARFGNYGDGGYAIVDDLKESDVLFSIGVGDNVSFDEECEKRVSRVVLVDHTVPNFNPPIGKFEMIRKPLVPGEDSGNGVTIHQLLSQQVDAKDYVLKVDIEGAEWEILSDLASLDLVKFRQIILEFHGLNNFLDLEEKLSALKKLASTHSPIVVHANNQGSHRFISGMFLPDVLEVTWVRTNSYTFNSERNQDIRNLLSPNSPDLPSLWIDWIDGKTKSIS